MQKPAAPQRPKPPTSKENEADNSPKVGLFKMKSTPIMKPSNNNPIFKICFNELLAPPQSPPPSQPKAASPPPPRPQSTPQPQAAPSQQSPPSNNIPSWNTPAQNNPPSSEPKKESGGRGGGEKSGGERSGGGERGSGRGKESKKEEEYIQSGGARNQIESYMVRKEKSNELARTVDFVSCQCSMRVPNFEIKMKNNKPDYVVCHFNETTPSFEVN